METPVTEILRLPTVESKPRPREMLGQFLTSFSGNCGAKFWKNFLPGWRLRSTKPPKFSILPYFLYCRAIELGLKAIHLETDKQQDVKDEYGHNLVKSYELCHQSGEPSLRQTLTFSRKSTSFMFARRLSMCSQGTQPTPSVVFLILNSSLDWQPISQANDD
jgi:hypothetical protein